MIDKRLCYMVLLVLPLLGGCPESKLSIQRPAGKQVHLMDVWAAPEGDVFAVGYDGTMSGQILQLHEGTWSILEYDNEPTSVWGTSSSDVYVGAREAADPDESLLHWDGAGWSAMGSSVPGDGAPLSAVFDIFGSGPDDMWLIASRDGTDIRSVFHWDGTVWTVHSGAQWTPEFPYEFYPTFGCRADADNVWISGLFMEPGSWSDGMIYHWDGVTWTPDSAPQSAIPGGLACRGEQIWSTGRCDSDFHVIYKYDAGQWREIYNTLDDFGVGDIPNFTGVWIGEDGIPWIAGSKETGGYGTIESMRIWRVVDGQLVTKVKGGEDRGRLTAVTVDNRGTVWAVGENGLVVQLPAAE